MQNLPDIPNGIPMVVAGIPTVQTAEGIVSPFPYLNSESDEWKGADEDGGFDLGGGDCVLKPNPDDDTDGGEEADIEDDEDDYDDSDTGFGAGLMGLLFGTAPPNFMPA